MLIIEAGVWISLFLIVYTYLGYPAILWLLARRARIEETGRLSETSIPSVSLIIAAHNERRVMSEKLTNAESLAYPQDKLEVIVASDGSTDGTNEIVRACPWPSLRLVALPEHRGKAAALNAAVASASGELLVFSDANTLFQSDALHVLVTHFSNPRVGCVSGRLSLVNPSSDEGGRGEGAYWRLETWIKTKESRLGSVIGANGAIYAIRRGLFTEIPVGLINDDFFVSMKVLEQGYRALFEPAAIGQEETAPSLEGEYRRHVRDAAGHFQVLPHLSGLLRPRHKFTSFAFFSHRILRWLLPFVLMFFSLATLLLSGRAVYAALSCGVATFVLLGAVGWALRRTGRRMGPLILPLYFLVLNWCIVVGLVQFCRKRIVWEKVR